jgi:hypothetical protein
VGFGAFLITLNATSTESYRNTSPNTTSTITPSFSKCLYEVPANATLMGFGNASTEGNEVEFTNGTSVYYPLNSCPQPLSPEEYALASVIEQNSTFLADENGSNYYVDQGISYSYYNGVNHVVVTFDKWSDVMYEPCGPSFGWGLYDLGQLQVIITIQKPTNSYDFLNMTIFVVPSSAFNVVDCPTITAGSSNQSNGYNSSDRISLPEGITLCASSCGAYPSPYLSSLVLVNSTAHLRSLQLIINGTLELETNYTNDLNQFGIQYKATPNSPNLSIVSGKSYFVTFVASFEDDTRDSASAVVIAS